MDLMRELAANLTEDEWTRLFSPEGLARQTVWDCEDGWLVGYTTERIRSSHQGYDGKFAVMAWRPYGKGARGGRRKARQWKRVYFRAFVTRKAARNRAEILYYRHSPKIAKRHGRVEGGAG